MDKFTYPRITVVTPSYNQGKYLKQTILSVITQEYPNLEYIVLDGGSTDGSKEIISKYNKYITYWRSEPDGGQANAIADGFEMATGEILCWINSDDLLLYGVLRKVGEFFASHPEAKWIYGAAATIDKDNKVLYYRKPFPVTPRIMASVVQGIVQQSCFWRKDFYQQVGGLNRDLKFCMDLDLFIRFIHSDKPYRIPDVLGAFRLHEETKTSRWNTTKRQEDQLIRDQYNQKISNLMRRIYWLYTIIWQKMNNVTPRKPTYIKIPELNYKDPLGNLK